MSLQEYLEYLIDWLKNEVANAKVKGLILGISGGIDSAVVACLVKKAFPNNSLGICMPINSNSRDLEDALLLLNGIEMDHLVLDLSSSYDLFKNSIFDNIEIEKKSTKDHQLALANTKARLRMTTLYAIGQTYNYLVVGTDNAAEWHTGYFTKYGDGGVDLVPLIHLTKKEVRKAASLLGVPKCIIDKAPTAGLTEDCLTDEQEMNVTYDSIDNYLLGEYVNQKDLEVIENLHRKSSHKRELAKKPLAYRR